MQKAAAGLILACLAALPASAQEPDDPELIFKRTTVWRMLSPDAKLATYAIDDPLVQGVACHFTVPEIGGWTGWLGWAEERSETSLACRQIGPVSFKGKFEQGGEVYRQRRSFFFKKMRIVRGCDPKRNVLVYLSYTDKLIEGSPQNSTSTVPIMPWGSLPAPKCADFLQ
jgi:CreA protein